MITRQTIDEINNKTNIVDVIGKYVRLEKRGGRYWGLSPFKQEKTPSFTVDPDKGFYYCFSTHQGGDLIKFVMTIERYTFYEAVKYLANRVGVEVEQDKGAGYQSNSISKALKDLNMRIAHSYHYILISTDEGHKARAMLDERKISADTIRRYTIGYCPSDPLWLYTFLCKKGYSADLLKKCGLFRRDMRTSHFAGRIVFPIRNRSQDIIAFGGRTLDTGDPKYKYINSSDSILYKKKHELFTDYSLLRTAKTDDPIYVVEGYFDLLAMREVGIDHAVATLGTAFSADHARVIKRYSSNAVLLYDGDSAGADAARRSALIMQQADITPAVCILPTDTDPADLRVRDEAFQKNAVEYIRERTQEIIPFLIQWSNKNNRQNNREKLAIKMVFEYINTVSSAIRRDQLIDQVGKLLNIQQEAVKIDFQEYMNRGFRHAPKREYLSTIPDRNQAVELECMITSVLFPHEFMYVRSILDIGYFSNPQAIELFNIQDAAYHNNENNTEDIIKNISNEHLRMLIKAQWDEKKHVPDGTRLVRTSVHTLKRRHLMKYKHEIINQMKTSESDASSNMRADSEIIQKLQHELLYLEGEIKKYSVA